MTRALSVAAVLALVAPVWAALDDETYEVRIYVSGMS